MVCLGKKEKKIVWRCNPLNGMPVNHSWVTLHEFIKLSAMSKEFAQTHGWKKALRPYSFFPKNTTHTRLEYGPHDPELSMLMMRPTHISDELQVIDITSPLK